MLGIFRAFLGRTFVYSSEIPGRVARDVGFMKNHVVVEVENCNGVPTEIVNCGSNHRLIPLGSRQLENLDHVLPLEVL